MKELWRVRPTEFDSTNQYGAFNSKPTAVSYAQMLENKGKPAVVLNPDLFVIYPEAVKDAGEPTQRALPSTETQVGIPVQGTINCDALKTANLIINDPTTLILENYGEKTRTTKETLKDILSLFGYLFRRLFRVKT